MNSPNPGKCLSVASLIAVACFCCTFPIHAQLVNDGATATLNHATNTVTGGLIIGTNGSFTLLVLTNGALLTNSGSSYIGVNATAKSNAVRVISSNTRWFI